MNGPALLAAHLRKEKLSFRAFAKKVGTPSGSLVLMWTKKDRSPGLRYALAIQAVTGIPLTAWPKRLVRGGGRRSPRNPTQHS
jgi:hypothetical protein